MTISQAAIDNNLIIGTPAPDSIAGLENTDTILGAESADILVANQDLDLINGNQGSDSITGNQSAEMLRGGQNNDFITGDNGEDTILGDLGSDTVIGDRGDDVIFGDPYEDVDFAGDGKDFLYGGQGKDTLFGGADNDLVSGNEQSDIVYGNKGNDTIYGGQSTDTIYGGQENDQVFGDKANDVLWGDLGADTLTGGTGDDVFVIGRRNDVTGFQSTGGSTIAQADVITDFGDGLDLIALTGGLTFDDLDIFQGSGENVGNTIIQDKSTGEFLANLQGIDVSNLIKANFTYSTVRINNYLTFDRPTYTIAEDGTPALNIGINRTGGIDEAVSATLFATDGTATSPTDYNNTPITVNFAPGETTQTVAIPIISDDIVEGEESFNLSLGFPFNGATVGTPQKATVTITDNGDTVAAAEAGTIEFSSPTFAVNEDGAPIASVTLNRTGDGSGAVSTKVLLNGGTAIGGSAPLAEPIDYDNSFITVEWEDGDTTPKTIEIPIADDTVIEGNESINLTLCDCTGGATVGEQGTAVLTIVDNEGVPSALNPEIDLFVGGTGIADDTGEVDFGTANVGDDLTKTFTIENTSPTDTLNINGWELPEGYCLEGTIPGVIEPNSQANFTVSVDTMMAGNPSGVIAINTNDRDESPFDFAVSALIEEDGDITPDPDLQGGEIQLLTNGKEISVDRTKAIDLGEASVGEDLSQTFTIRNTSSEEVLILSNFTLPDEFTVAGTFPDSIAPNSKETITINADTSTAGNMEGTFSFVTSDSDESSFNLNIKATVNEETPTQQGGEVVVLDNGIFDLTDGSPIPVNFGKTNVGETLNKTFTIRNTSSQEPLILSDLSLPEGFSLAGEFPNSIAPNSEEVITVNVDTSTVGNPEGTLSFVTSDSDESPFNFGIKATVNEETPTQQGGEVEVLDGGVGITDGSTSVYDLGIVDLEESLAKTFTIRNISDSEELVLSNLTLPDGFNLEGDFPDPIAPNSEASFTINVDTTTVTNWEGTLSFETNDTDENPFDFAIGATVRDPSAPVEIFGSPGRDRIQGDDNGVDIISPGGGADIITWTNVPPQGITDEIIGFMPNQDKLQFAVANFGGISNIIPVTVTQLLSDGTNISGNNLIIFDEGISFADRSEVDLALAEQNGTSDFPAFFVYSAGGERFLGYDPILNSAGDATNIAKFDVAPTAESFSFFN
ncbi:MAG: choice-of-anchor D domain-containing protein [Phormidium sp.]